MGDDAFFVEEETFDDGVVEHASDGVGGAAVDIADVDEGVETPVEDVCADGEGSTGVVPVGFDAGAFVSELVDPGADLVLRESFFGEVE